MTLSTIPSHVSVFVDANIFIYHFVGRSESCTQLIRRIEERDVKAFTSAHIVSEMIHRMMMLEALQKGLIISGSPSKKLQKRRKLIGNLQVFANQGRQLLTFPMEIISLTDSLLREGIGFASKYHLLMNDALVIAAMKEKNLSHLASADLDFQTVPEVKLYCPRDI